jgi:hypothetical protein
VNRQITTADIELLLDLHRLPLDKIEESGHEWWLGSLSISKQHREFRSGFGHSLQSESGFRKQWFEFDDGRRGWAAIFQAFDPNSPNPELPEYFLGWVQPEREHELDQWIAFLNSEIRKRLQTVQYVGHFVELGYDHIPYAPSLAASRGKRTAEHKAAVVRYLQSGKTLVFSPGVDTDFFDETRSADTRSIITDGTYAWPKVVAYYVEHYDVKLTPMFEDHMRANDWKVPESIDVKALKLPVFNS